MPIMLILLLAIMLAVLLGPQWWVRHVLERHGVERADLPGTGGELARHLLDLAGLRGVKVELTGDGDHYDPEERAVRLLPQHHDGRSVAAVAVAAHEVSHAVQHANGEPAFALRFDLVRKVIWIDRIASGLLLLAPVILILVKAPAVFIDKIKNLRDAFSAQYLFYLRKSRVRHLDPCDQCSGKIVNATLVRVRKLWIG